MQTKPRNIKFQRKLMHLTRREMIETHFYTGYKTSTTFFFLATRVLVGHCLFVVLTEWASILTGNFEF